ncbi:MAG: Plasmid stabilization system [Parcubacteria group bacterium Gr01-1014_29]|nr:MAG: Plasmid stabilization system [Parcubacteria group bacterium Gr01-1014_29]
MIGLQYAPKFLKQLSKLDPALQKEAFAKIELFKDKKNHQSLEVHKLQGRLSGSYAFSVNYKDRIVFDYVSKSEAVLLAIGDHDVYKK